MVAKLRAPGLYRAFFAFLLGIAFAAGLTWIVRMATGHATYHHFLSEEPVMAVSLITAPLFFLVGLGGFDYWL
jgi:cytochrome c oxidase subunit I